MKKLILLLCLLAGTACYADDDDGRTGPRGPQGPQGVQGVQGAQGPAGTVPATPLITPILDLGLQVYASRRMDANLTTTFMFNQPSVTYMMGVSVLFKPFHFRGDK